MRRSHLISALAAALLVPSTGVWAESSEPGSGVTEDASTLGDSGAVLPDEGMMETAEAPAPGDATSDPVAGDASSAANVEPSADIALSETTGPRTAQGIVLGPQGIDDQGRTGRLHTVSRGDTLWDLSAAYLGTPWVWPSVWTDNDDIANPHLIRPGDKIWITANEMRVVSDAEAEAFLSAAVPSEPAASDPGFESGAADEFAPVAAFEEEDSTFEAFPATVAGQQPETLSAGRQITVSRRDSMGFVSAEELAGASSIVDSPVERTYLAEGDPVYVGVGEGDVEVGDRFTIFRVLEEVRDVETRRVLGHHVENLGWLEIKELTGDTSIGQIRQSFAEIARGTRVLARAELPRHVTLRTTPDAIEGRIVFLPSERTVMPDGGYVYLNRGEFHGVEVGSELEVYEAGGIHNDAARRVDVQTPDHGVATLVVVSVQPESSVAFVLRSARELEVGDLVRPAVARMAKR